MPPPPDAAPTRGDPNARALPPHLSLVSGLLMGGADAIPGVSGGTIALIIGIYERFIDALSTVIRAPWALRSAGGRARVGRALALLVPLGVGVLASYFAATKLLVGPTEDPGILRLPQTAPYCYAFFFGLVLVSLREPWRRIRAPGSRHLAAAATAALAAAVFVALMMGGAGAIAVMLLPGVSGSLLLVILGQYAVVAAAVHDRDVGVLAVFALGLVAGVATFVPVLKRLLRTHHDVTMAALTGLMAGSLRALWPWKVGYDPKAGSMANTGIEGGGLEVALAVAAAATGGLAVLGLSLLERRVLRARDGASEEGERR